MHSPIDYPGFDLYEEEIDEDVERAKPDIEDIILQQRAVTERELKVRLEDKYFPWITGRALSALEREGIVRSVGYVGRRAKGGSVPELFYIPFDMPYDRVVGVIAKKRQVTRDINAILTAHAPAGYHAEDLFEQAFQALHFKIHRRDASYWGGRQVRGVKGKQPPDLDFIIEKNKIVYGVDVKNWIKYEYATRKDVSFKVGLALQLGIVPFILARYVDKETIFLEVIKKGGICYPYKTLLIPSTYESLADEASRILGYPTLAVDVLPRFKVKWIDKLHKDFLDRKRKG